MYFIFISYMQHHSADTGKILQQHQPQIIYYLIFIMFMLIYAIVCARMLTVLTQ